MREVLEMRLRAWGFDVRLASDGAEGKQWAESYDPDIVVSDVVMPGLSGLELLRSLKAGNPSRPVILITAQGSIDMAVEAMKQGAEDFITKPLDYAKLKAILDIAQRDIAQRLESGKPPYPLDKESGFGPFVGMSKRMRAVYDLIQTLRSAIEHRDEPLGGETLFRTVATVSQAECERCWQLLFDALDRFDGSRNRGINHLVRFLRERDQRETRRLLANSPIWGTQRWGTH